MTTSGSQLEKLISLSNMGEPSGHTDSYGAELRFGDILECVLDNLTPGEKRYVSGIIVLDLLNDRVCLLHGFCIGWGIKTIPLDRPDIIKMIKSNCI